jgi:hypothetical protein
MSKGEPEPIATAAVVPDHADAVQSELIISDKVEPPAQPMVENEESIEAVDDVPESESKEEPVEEMRVGPTADSVATAPGQSATMPSDQLDVIDSGAKSQFARLVRGWETYVHHGTRNVQLGLQNLNLCGEGLARLSGGEEDLFAPIVLRHTHSSPLNYSSMFGNSDDLPPATGFENMRRSSSTPSTSAFRQRSAGSAFETNLRAMPILTGPDDRSAFTLPMQRSSYASASDAGIRYNSAFNPVNFQTDMEETEMTSIEVLDIGPSEVKEKTAQKWPAAAKAKKFLKDNARALRRRRRRGGREKSEEDGSRKVDDADDGDNETISSNSTGREVQVIASLKSEEEEKNTTETHDLTAGFPTVREEEEEDGDGITHKISGSPQDSSQYHNLDSDVDEEYAHYHRIEAIHNSPGNVPSPLYQQFVDRGETPPTAGVRVQVSVTSPSPPTQIPPVSSIDSSQLAIRRTTSQDSGAESPGTAMSTLTSNTSGHTTLGTSTSATVSSGRLTILSVVSETDREVMETNKAGKRLHQESQGRPKTEGDGDATIHSSSTASTGTNGYLALGSPGPLRDGASLLTDRFFKASRILVSHSASTNSGSTNSGSSSSGTSGGSLTTTNRPDAGTATMPRVESHLTESTTNPFAASTQSISNTVSSGSTQSDDPPTFVSYLDRQLSADTPKTLARGNTRSSPPALAGVSEERESPAQIVEYTSQVIFEAAKPDSQKLFRPVNKRDRKASSRPPLSPIKGLKMPTTPPPYQRPDSTSPAYQQLSPPNIVDHRVQRSDLSKPYVLRSTAAPQVGGVILVSPDRGGASNPAVPSDDRESSPQHHTSSTLFEQEQPDVGRSRTYRETSIEVEKHEMSKEATVVVVTPEKQSTGNW